MEVNRLRIDVMNNRLCPSQQGECGHGADFGFFRQATLIDQRTDLGKPAMIVLMRQVDAYHPSANTSYRSPGELQSSRKIGQ
jgi:hypothetical protein